MSIDGDGFGISIGAVARATGIPTNTLRTWERRYGFPRSKRSGGGQRLYDPDVVGHLRLVKRALEQGFRPGQIFPLDSDALRDLVGRTAIPDHEWPWRAYPVAEDDWMACLHRLDGGWARRARGRSEAGQATPL